jgi:hypothetical protein
MLRFAPAGWPVCAEQAYAAHGIGRGGSGGDCCGRSGRSWRRARARLQLRQALFELVDSAEKLLLLSALGECRAREQSAEYESVHQLVTPSRVFVFRDARPGGSIRIANMTCIRRDGARRSEPPVNSRGGRIPEVNQATGQAHGIPSMRDLALYPAESASRHGSRTARTRFRRYPESSSTDAITCDSLRRGWRSCQKIPHIGANVTPVTARVTVSETTQGRKAAPDFKRCYQGGRCRSCADRCI